MPTVEQEVLLNARVERVWEFLGALRYLPLWMEDVKAVSALSTPAAAAGTTYTVTPRRGHHDESWIVAVYEPTRRMRLAEYRRNMQIMIELEPRDEQTQLSMRLEWPGRYGLLGSLLPPSGQRRRLERSLARLQELIKLNQDIKVLHGMGDE